MLEPGIYPLDRPLRIHSRTTLCGGGQNTILVTTARNSAGIGILCREVHNVQVSDLCVDGDLKRNSVAGLVLDRCADCSVQNVTSRNFRQYGFQIKNKTAFSKIFSCTASNNTRSNFFLDHL